MWGLYTCVMVLPVFSMHPTTYNPPNWSEPDMCQPTRLHSFKMFINGDINGAFASELQSKVRMCGLLFKGHRMWKLCLRMQSFGKTLVTSWLTSRLKTTRTFLPLTHQEIRLTLFVFLFNCVALYSQHLRGRLMVHPTSQLC